MEAPDEVPTITLNLNGESFEATPYNATLFTFCGRTLLENGDTFENASRNHVFLKTGETREEEGRKITQGTYIFGEAVGRIGAVMLHNQFPAELHAREIHPGDEAAYQQYIEGQETAEDVPDFLPTEWEAQDGA